MYSVEQEIGGKDLSVFVVNNKKLIPFKSAQQSCLGTTVIFHLFTLKLIQRQVKSLYCTYSKQAQSHLCSVLLTYSKKRPIPCLLHANICLPVVQKIHTD